MAVLAKLKSGRFFLIDKLHVGLPSTQVISMLLNRLGLNGKSCIVATSAYDCSLMKSCRNIPKLNIFTITDMNAGVVCRSEFMIATKDAMDLFKQRVPS